VFLGMFGITKYYVDAPLTVDEINDCLCVLYLRLPNQMVIL
jgi:hypothetical protein